MFLFVVFLLTDVSVVAVFWAVYGRVGKYREGMLLGVHLPSYREHEPEVQAVMDSYWKNTKRFYIGNLIVSAASAFLCFWYSSVFIIFWSIWLLQLIAGSQYLMYRYNRKLYDIKVEKNWNGGPESRIVAVSSDITIQKGRKPFSVWFHLPVFLLIGVLLLVPGVRQYVFGETDGAVLSGLCLFLSVLFVLLHLGTVRREDHPYSSDADASEAVNRWEKRTLSLIWIVCNYINIASFTILANKMDKNKWIEASDYILFVILQMFPAVLILAGMFYIRWKKEKMLADIAPPLIYADDDIYWKNGWYSNPSNPKLLVKDRFCSTNYTVNLGRTSGKILMIVPSVFTIGLLAWVCVIFVKIDFIPTTVSVNGSNVEFSGSGYDDTFKKDDIINIELLETLPDENLTRVNGVDDGHHLAGKFKGKESGDCRLYIYKDYTPILHIELPEYHIYANSKKTGEVQGWYKNLMIKAGESYKGTVRD